jgi:hypothetical protein
MARQKLTLNVTSRPSIDALPKAHSPAIFRDMAAPCFGATLQHFWPANSVGFLFDDAVSCFYMRQN